MRHVLIASLLAFASTPALAGNLPPQGLEVGALAYEGSGCPEGSALGALAANGTYGILFSGLEAAAQPFASASSRCTVRVDVRLPVNYKMQVASVAIQGKHDAPGASRTTVFTDYTMNDYRIGYDLDPKAGACKEHYQPALGSDEILRDAQVTQISGIPTAAGNWDIAWKNQDVSHYTGCGGNVAFGGTVEAVADSNGADEYPEMVVQRMDATLRYSLGWGWRFEKCRAILDGTWRAEFTDVNGAVRRGSMALSFGRGSVSGAGAAILFSSIDQEDTLVTGTWRRGSEQGWVRWHTPVNPPLNVLEGEWGYGIDQGEDAIGRFSAQRVR